MATDKTIVLDTLEGQQPRCSSNNYHDSKLCNECENKYICLNCKNCDIKDTCNIKDRIIFYKSDVQYIICKIKKTIKAIENINT